MDHHRAQQQQHAGMQPQMMSSSAESGLQLLGNLNNSSNASGGNGNSLAGSDDPAPFNPIKSLLQQLQQQQRDEEQQVYTFLKNLFFYNVYLLLYDLFLSESPTRFTFTNARFVRKGLFASPTTAATKTKRYLFIFFNMV